MGGVRPALIALQNEKLKSVCGKRDLLASSESREKYPVRAIYPIGRVFSLFFIVFSGLWETFAGGVWKI